MIENIIVGVILVLMIGAAAFYIYKAKKSGKKCIGCPEGCSCSTKPNGDGDTSCGCGCGCGGEHAE